MRITENELRRVIRQTISEIYTNKDGKGAHKYRGGRRAVVDDPTETMSGKEPLSSFLSRGFNKASDYVSGVFSSFGRKTKPYEEFIKQLGHRLDASGAKSLHEIKIAVMDALVICITGDPTITKHFTSGEMPLSDSLNSELKYLQDKIARKVEYKGFESLLSDIEIRDEYNDCCSM